MGLERGRNGAQICHKFLGQQVGILWRNRMARSFCPGKAFERSSQAGVNAGQCAAVRFVFTVFVLVG